MHFKGDFESISSIHCHFPPFRKGKLSIRQADLILHLVAVVAQMSSIHNDRLLYIHLYLFNDLKKRARELIWNDMTKKYLNIAHFGWFSRFCYKTSGKDDSFCDKSFQASDLLLHPFENKNMDERVKRYIPSDQLYILNNLIKLAKTPDWCQDASNSPNMERLNLPIHFNVFAKGDKKDVKWSIKTGIIWIKWEYKIIKNLRQ